MAPMDTLIQPSVFIRLKLPSATPHSLLADQRLPPNNAGRHMSYPPMRRAVTSGFWLMKRRGPRSSCQPRSSGRSLSTSKLPSNYNAKNLSVSSSTPIPCISKRMYDLQRHGTLVTFGPSTMALIHANAPPKGTAACMRAQA